MKKQIILSIVIMLAIGNGCHGSMSDEQVMQKYIAAFNAHDLIALKQIVADTAQYGQSGGSRTPRLLVEQNKEAWEHPVTADMKMSLGTLSGKKVVVLWGKWKLPDGSFSHMTKLLYLDLEISKGLVRHATRTMMLDQPNFELRDKIVAEPPQ